MVLLFNKHLFIVFLKNSWYSNNHSCSNINSHSFVYSSEGPCGGPFRVFSLRLAFGAIVRGQILRSLIYTFYVVILILVAFTILLLLEIHMDSNIKITPIPSWKQDNIRCICHCCLFYTQWFECGACVCVLWWLFCFKLQCIIAVLWVII